MKKKVSSKKLVKKSVRIAILRSRFNPEVTLGLEQGAREALAEKGNVQIDAFEAPGAFELPLMATLLARTKKYDGILCLGCVIKGDTAHFEFISLGASMGVMQAMLEHELPISFGILTTYTEEQSQIRSIPGSENKGREAALAAWEVIEWRRNLNASKTKKQAR